MKGGAQANRSAVRQNQPETAEALRAVVEQSQLNALRLALLQATGDPRLAGISVSRQYVRGGALFSYDVSPDDRERTIAVATEILQSGKLRPEVPERPCIDHMMQLYDGMKQTQPELDLGYEELGFDPLPRAAEWKGALPAVAARTGVVIVGAGIAGIAIAVQLQHLGIPFRIIERQDDIGGTWNLNAYPDARVDTPSHLYRFTFALDYEWSEYFATQGETKAYMKHCAARYGLEPHISFRTSLDRGVWNEAARKWDLVLSGPEGEERIRADVVISASGVFSTPKMPDIPGLATFRGPIFHTTAWDHGVAVEGKRIALIGTGSSGVQVAATLAKAASKLTIVQRTPNWIARIADYKKKMSRGELWLFANVPFYRNWYSYHVYRTAVHISRLQEIDTDWQGQGGLVNRENDLLRQALVREILDACGGDEELAAKCTPRFAPLARRLVTDNGWFEALKQPHVELKSCGVSEITPGGLVMEDGSTVEADVIVLGTGFHVSRFTWPAEYVGRGGRTLAEAWSTDGARAYLGLSVPGFPNFFMMYGPNAQPRAIGLHSFCEMWSRYIARSIARMLEKGISSLECRQEVFDAYNRDLDRALKSCIWEVEGQGSYYVNEFGRTDLLMPWYPADYRQRILEPNFKDYRITHGLDDPPH